MYGDFYHNVFRTSLESRLDGRLNQDHLQILSAHRSQAESLQNVFTQLHCEENFRQDFQS